jgi:hypothetical protein
MRTYHLGFLLVMATAACIPPEVKAGSDVPTAGIYPADRTKNAGLQPALRDEAWAPAADYVSVMAVPGSIASMLTAVPPTGSPVSERSYAWPAPLQLTDFGPEGVKLLGVPFPATRFSGEIRCLGLPADVHVRLTVRIAAAGPGMRIEVRSDTPADTPCEISHLGRRRLDAIASDVWMWARAVVVRGSVIPAGS